MTHEPDLPPSTSPVPPDGAQPAGDLAPLWSDWISADAPATDRPHDGPGHAAGPAPDDVSDGASDDDAHVAHDAPDDDTSGEAARPSDGMSRAELSAAIHERVTFGADDIFEQELESLRNVGNPTGSALTPDGDYEVG